MSLKPFRERLQRIEVTLAARPSPNLEEERWEMLALTDEIAIGALSSLSARIANVLAQCSHRPSQGTCATCIEGDAGVMAAWTMYVTRMEVLQQDHY